MKVIEVPIEQIKPYENNPRINDDAIHETANSIKEFGWQQPIVVDKDNVIIVGHTRLKAAKQLGLTKVPVVIADKLSDEQVKAYRLADNKVGELADWDLELLDLELNDITELDMSGFGFDFVNKRDDENDKPTFDDSYSQKVNSINYEPNGEKPKVSDLADTSKYLELVDRINASKLPKEVQEFLKLGASRFIKFDFAKIADFYAHSDKNIQTEFEEQLLVIIDYDKAIEKGIAQFNLGIRDEEMEQIGVSDERFK